MLLRDIIISHPLTRTYFTIFSLEYRYIQAQLKLYQLFILITNHMLTITKSRIVKIFLILFLSFEKHNAQDTFNFLNSFEIYCSFLVI